MTVFNKTEFQTELSKSIEIMISGDAVINDAQLLHFVDYFHYKNPNYTLDDLKSYLEETSFKKALRMLMVYNTLALTLHDPYVYAAAVEVFPLDAIPAARATLLLAILNHIQQNPMSIQPALGKSTTRPFE